MKRERKTMTNEATQRAHASRRRTLQRELRKLGAPAILPDGVPGRRYPRPTRSAYRMCFKSWRDYDRARATGRITPDMVERRDINEGYW